ncbi:MAG: UDP-N-acetylglucosamine 2-epimerase (non-hydrolyzing) [Planctomycetota bacterium]
MKQLKVMTCLGTRPEIIRLSRVLSALDEHTDHVLVHTGQNWDYELNELFFEELKVRKPDHFLGVDVSSLGAVLGNILIEIEKVLLKEQPDAFLVLGDTNSSIAAIMAKRMRIPVYHMEAGNRCFDPNVPEETNRKLIDHLADFNLAYTEHARRHLLQEGCESRRIYVTGSPLREVFNTYREGINASTILEDHQLEKGKYFIVSAHREENVDHPERLGMLIDTLEALAEEYQVPVLVSTHPRTQKRLNELGRGKPKGDICFLKPFGYFDYNRLQQDCMCALSDSGTISEESAMMKFPAVTLRQAIERPEAMDTGTITVCGLDAENVCEAVAATIKQYANGQVPEVPVDYQVTNTSQRVLNLILGTARQHRAWSNLAMPTGFTRDS